MCFNKDNLCCCIITIISAILSAVGIGGIFFAGLIATITPLLYVTLALGIIELLYVIISGFCGNKSKKAKNICQIPIIVGSIVTSVFALVATTLPVASISAVLLVIAVAFFLVMSLINLLNSIVYSLFRCPCED